MRVKSELTAGEWAVLALLCEEPRHGYAIASLMAPDGEIGRVWSLRRPMAYRSMAELERAKLIVVDAVEPCAKAPARRIMRATPEAQERVAVWLEQPEEHVRDLRSSLLLRMHFLRRRGRPTVGLLRVRGGQRMHGVPLRRCRSRLAARPLSRRAPGPAAATAVSPP